MPIQIRPSVPSRAKSAPGDGEPGPLARPRNVTRTTARIGQILIQDGVIDRKQEKQAADIQARDPSRKFGEILVRELGVDHHAVYSRLAAIYAFKVHEFAPATLADEDLDFIRNIMRDLPEDARERALTKKVLPLQPVPDRQELLLVVTADPTDPEVLELASQFGFRRTEICYSRLDAIESIIGRLGTLVEALPDHVDDVAMTWDTDDEDRLDEEALDAEINQSALTNLIEGCLVDAVRRGASDIHIVPEDESRSAFYLRIDGKLQPWRVQESTKPEAIIAVVKDRTRGVDRFERDKAQDGFIQREIDGNFIRFRVSILPVAGSQPHRRFEDIVIRILDDRKVISDLDKLGLDDFALDAVKASIRKPQGMVIVTGPTGSGKSTTLNAALHHVMSPARCTVTVEDPVEYLIRGARQVKIGPSLHFEDAVRTILRHDPDIVMVGEIRDEATAETAVKLANTGHLTFSTLHTNDSPSAVSRLYTMGVEPFLLASAVNLVLAQRLVRTLCQDCRRPATPNRKFVRACLKLGMPARLIEQATFCRPVGCPACGGTGYRGRAGVHEALPFTREIRQLIVSGGERIDEDALRVLALDQGMVTLRQSALRRVARGETTLVATLEATQSET